MMAIDRHRESRLTRRLYETSIVLSFATLIALFSLLAVGARTHSRLACVAKSIVASSARCTGAPEIGRDLPSDTVNVVFPSSPSFENAER